MIETHTHSFFSFDGKADICDMLKRARELGVEYYCVTDHFDYDYSLLPEYQHVRQIDLAGYLKRMKELKKDFPFLHIGCELGYSQGAIPLYQKLPFEEFDSVLNSVHTVGQWDAYNKKFFIGKEKHEAYKQYLDKIRESLEAPYPYNTVTHIGYVRKNAPYKDTYLYYEEFKEELDGILKRIIELDKALEINSKLDGGQLMPEQEVWARYYQLGGRKITFASDSHEPSRLGHGFFEAEKKAAEVGFTYWTVFEKQRPVSIPFGTVK